MATQESSPITNIPSHALVRIHPDEEQAFIALRGQVTGFLVYSENRIITNAEDVKLATEDLALMSGVKKAIEEKRVEFTGPLNDYVKGINATFKQLSDPLAQADKITRDKVLAYRAEQERKRIEAEAINRQKIDLARREAALNEGEITVDLTPVIVPTAEPSHIFTDTGSLGTSKIRKWEVEDLSKVPLDYLMIDAAKVGKVVRAGIPSIPGIRIWLEDSLRITTR